jgi:hypothetical protein
MTGIGTKSTEGAHPGKETRPGTHADGGGISLIFNQRGTKKWELRTTIGGRRRQLGLGIYPTVSLHDARNKAAQIREGASEGRDLMAELRQSK